VAGVGVAKLAGGDRGDVDGCGRLDDVSPIRVVRDRLFGVAPGVGCGFRGVIGVGVLGCFGGGGEFLIDHRIEE
jgi:hypothetical protein